jgi:hypothetical protein
MGLDDWPVEQGASEIHEPRLLRAVQTELGEQITKLITPPVAPETAGWQANPFDDAAHIGVTVAPFPHWLLCPYCRLLAPLQSGLFELKLNPFRKDHSRYVHHNCTKAGKAPTAIPARFLVACRNGHLDDFQWVRYVHRVQTDCKYELRLYELGASGEVADIQVQCETCGAKRRMSDAFGEGGEKNLPACRGRWPQPSPVTPLEAEWLEYCDPRCHELVQVCLAQSLPPKHAVAAVFGFSTNKCAAPLPGPKLVRFARRQQDLVTLLCGCPLT